MKRSPGKKSGERRKRSRSKSNLKTPPKSTQPGVEADPQECCHCSKDLTARHTKSLFVEEEIGRTFCSEDCITSFFGPDIERLEKEYFKRLSQDDLSGEERESFAHLRWITLQEPDEVWREKTLTGDYRYTLISEFQPNTLRIWCVCICLFLRGEPSFLHLAFVTKNAALMNVYRKGERAQMSKDGTSEMEDRKGQNDLKERTEMGATDGLASDWTEDETIRAQLNQERKTDDIPAEDFNLYQSCLEETLEAPDEVWTVDMKRTGARRLPTDTVKLYHFIRYYPQDTDGVWYLVVARETAENDEEIEILDAFPTRDENLVDRYRRGRQEVGTQGSKGQSRIVH